MCWCPHVEPFHVLFNIDLSQVNSEDNNVYICFIDYSKYVDCVDFKLMWRTLSSSGMPKYRVECLKVKDLYQNYTAEIETVVGRSAKWRSTMRCPFSLMLFNL